MKISTTDNVYFGQLVPTKPLLKALVNIHNYDEGRELYLSTNSQFVGNLGYHKRAAKIAEKAVQKNENLQKIIQDLTGLSKAEQIAKINKLTSSIGNSIDIEL
ncbi:MAG: hypothetical protein NC191_01735 [Muribaculaceae bacterium]|nr:hypothetical protein [Muribaculaceae bacterium]